MTEQEYIDATNLTSLRHGVDCLRNVLCMKPQEVTLLAVVHRILYDELIVPLEKEITIAKPIDL